MLLESKISFYTTAKDRACVLLYGTACPRQRRYFHLVSYAQSDIPTFWHVVVILHSCLGRSRPDSASRISLVGPWVSLLGLWRSKRERNSFLSTRCEKARACSILGRNKLCQGELMHISRVYEHGKRTLRRIWRLKYRRGKSRSVLFQQRFERL